MSESFVKIPTDIVKSHAISNLEFRVLANIVILSTYNDGHSFLGSFKLEQTTVIENHIFYRSK